MAVQPRKRQFAPVGAWLFYYYYYSAIAVLLLGPAEMGGAPWKRLRCGEISLAQAASQPCAPLRPDMNLPAPAALSPLPHRRNRHRHRRGARAPMVIAVPDPRLFGSIVVARETRAHVRRPVGRSCCAVGDFMLDKRSHRYFKADCFFFVYVFRIIFTLKMVIREREK